MLIHAHVRFDKRSNKIQCCAKVHFGYIGAHFVWKRHVLSCEKSLLSKLEKKLKSDDRNRY